MNKNLVRGLVVGIPLIIILVVLYVFFFMGTPPKTVPSPVTAPGPTAAVPPAVKPPAATPGPQEPAAVRPLEQPVPPKGVTPSPELSPPESKITVFPPEKEKEQYGLLVGRYRQYRRADKMLKKLKKRGIPGFIRRDPHHRGSYELWAGPFSDSHEAMAAEKSLRAILKRTPQMQKIVTPVPK